MEVYKAKNKEPVNCPKCKKRGVGDFIVDVNDPKTYKLKYRKCGWESEPIARKQLEFEGKSGPVA